MSEKCILSVRDLHVVFRLRNRQLHALRGVNLDVYEGETIAIVGESGSGKSVLNKNFIGLLDKNGRITQGSIRYYPRAGERLARDKDRHEDEEGRAYVELAAMRRNKPWRDIRGSQVCMVPQDPMTSLNPLKTIGWQLTEALKLNRGLRGQLAYEEAIRLLEDVKIDNPEERYWQYPHEFSGGMRQRVVIAIAIACNPRILICDEPTTALDVTIQAQVLQLIHEVKEKYGLTVIFITHDLGVVANVSDRVAVMYAGEIVEVGTTEEVFFEPQHPYTWALMSSLPQLGTKGKDLLAIRGTPPNLFKEVTGDAFAPRNPDAMLIDHLAEPPMFDVTETHRAKTWRLDPRMADPRPPKAIRKLKKRLKKMGGEQDG